MTAEMLGERDTRALALGFDVSRTRWTVSRVAAMAGGASDLTKAKHLTAIRRVGKRKALWPGVPNLATISLAKFWMLLWMTKLDKR